MKEYIIRIPEENAGSVINGEYIGEIVRCKDCKYYEETKPFSVIMTVCKYGDHTEWTEPNGYCHRAKRKQKGEK